MNIFKKKFPRKQEVLFIEAISNDTKEVAEEILKLRDKEGKLLLVRKRSEFSEVVKEIPEGRVMVFFNLEVLEYIRDRTFSELNRYVKRVKEENFGFEFYRGMKHGPCTIYACSKVSLPENFDGSQFLNCPAVAVMF